MCCVAKVVPRKPSVTYYHCYWSCSNTHTHTHTQTHTHTHTHTHSVCLSVCLSVGRSVGLSLPLPLSLSLSLSLSGEIAVLREVFSTKHEFFSCPMSLHWKKKSHPDEIALITFSLDQQSWDEESRNISLDCYPLFYRENQSAHSVQKSYNTESKTPPGLMWNPSDFNVQSGIKVRTICRDSRRDSPITTPLSSHAIFHIPTHSP